MGESLLAVDKTKSFTISGKIDYVQLEGDVSKTIVIARGWEYDKEGVITPVDFGKVLLDDGRFTFEAEVVEPIVLELYVDIGRFRYCADTVIVEPGADITVVQRGNYDISIYSSSRTGTGLHAKLIDSWQNSSKYISARNAYEIAYDNFEAEKIASRDSSQSENTTTDSVGQVSNEEERVSDTDLDTTELRENVSSGDPLEAISDTNINENEDKAVHVLSDTESELAEGCEHVDLSEVETELVYRLSTQTFFEVAPYQKYADQMIEIKYNALDKFARNVAEPKLALLALERGAIVHEDDSEAIRIFDELAKRLNDDLVARRVTPARNEIVQRVVFEENKRKVAPGQKAPEFVLVDLKNNEINLHEVAADRDLVLLDFWASWCGPCIATFPKLKELYSEYREAGFEIVSVAIDDTPEDWALASEEQDLPWINLGENQGWEGPTAFTYGVDFIPMSFLIDTEGCILQKDLQTSRLEEMLATRYGEIEKTE